MVLVFSVNRAFTSLASKLRLPSWKICKKVEVGVCTPALLAGATASIGIFLLEGCRGLKAVHCDTALGGPGSKATLLPQRPVHYVLRPDVDPRIDASVLIRFDPPEHLRTGAAFVVLPGGNYENCSMNKEGQKVAVWLNSLGITAFVLRYRLVPEGHYWPAQFEDLEMAIRQIRSHATAWQIDHHRIGVLGFSAGGHLGGFAANVCPPFTRPDLQILVYPCIDVTKPEWWPWKSTEGFPPPEDSVHLRLTRDAPPAFLAVSSEDGLCTAEENTEPYAAKLREMGVPVEHYVRPMGKHGHVLKGGWTEACEAWLQLRGWARVSSK